MEDNFLLPLVEDPADLMAGMGEGWGEGEEKTVAPSLPPAAPYHSDIFMDGVSHGDTSRIL